MKSVAIVGFYDPTLPHLLQSQVDEIWVPNHGYMVMGPRGDIPRCDRMFELHKQSWFRRKEMPKHEEYWRFLTAPQPFPIYLQAPIPEIPSGVVYPYEEVCADCFSHLLRKDTTGREIYDTFLTSSAAFMLALAIHERFERVEIYGIGMETETEYGYQLPGFTYLIGLANGRGIDVVNMAESPICKAEVYAYSAIPYTTLERLHELRRMYGKVFKEKQAAFHQIQAEFNSGRSQDMATTQAASDISRAYHGAVVMLDTLIQEGSQYLSRQTLEVKQRAFILHADTFKADANAASGEFDALLKKNRQAEAGEAWMKYLNARASMHANSGAVQLLSNLIAECDLRKPAHEIVLTIQDK
jgi:hypothetical protein